MTENDVSWIFVADLSADLVDVDLLGKPGAIAYIEAERHTRDAITEAILEVDP